MKNNFKNLYIVLISLVLPISVFAQTPGIGWNSALDSTQIEGSNFTSGSLVVNDLPNPQDLVVLVVVDDDNNYNNPLTILYIGTPPANGVMNFNATGFPIGTYYLPIVMTAAAYASSGPLFDPYNTTGVLYFGLDAQSIDSSIDTGNDVPVTDTDTGNDVPVSSELDLSSYTFNSIANPLGQEFNILEFLQKLFANLVKIAIPFLTVFLVYSGFLFVEARGNEEKLKTARSNFVSVIIGAVLVLGAWVIASALKGTVDQLEAPISFINHIINFV